MTSRLFFLLLLLLAAIPAAAQKDEKEDPADQLAMPLPEGVFSAVRFTVAADFLSAKKQATAFSEPVLLQLSADRYLQRFDMIVFDRTSSTFQSVWQFRTIFLFPDMGSFVQWYARPETTTMLSLLKSLGAKNLAMKLENIRNPLTVVQPK